MDAFGYKMIDILIFFVKLIFVISTISPNIARTGCMGMRL